MNCSPVAISGIGCISAAGLNLFGCMDSMLNGECYCNPPVRFSSSHSVIYPVFEVLEDFSSIVFNDKLQVSRTCKMAVAAACEAIDKARWDRKQMQNRRVGVCIGTTVGCAMNDEHFYKEYRAGLKPDMMPIKRFLASNPAAVIAREFNLTGPCQTIINACSSGTDAIGLGAAWIRSGICDAVIAGGSDELCRFTYNGFISMMITDDLPCRPFDKTRRGLNLGEGSAVLILESEDMVDLRKQPAIAHIFGYGSVSDAYHLTTPRPDGKGLKRAIAFALETSGIRAENIAFVNAHGTGTADNDRVEASVLSEILPGIPFFSTKGYTGHTLGAAGAIEAALTSAFLERGEIPASAGFTIRDPELPVSPLQYNKKISGCFAISESLAFGGGNAVLVLGR